jgi:hypothetical protein
MPSLPFFGVPPLGSPATPAGYDVVFSYGGALAGSEPSHHYFATKQEAEQFAADYRKGVYSLADGTLTKIDIRAIAGETKPTADRLRDAAADLAGKHKETYQRDDNGTKCNFFVRDFAKNATGVPIPELTGVKANEMFDKMKASRNWQPQQFQEDSAAAFKTAQEAANQGKLVVVAYKNPKGHGHVAVVVPNDNGLVKSGTWKLSVPYIAQAGETVFSKGKLSMGFSPARKKGMEIFIWDPKSSGPENPLP